MSEYVIRNDKEHGVTELILNRTEIHNAFDGEMITQIMHHLSNIEKDESIRVLVLKANGKHFSAGADLNWMQRMTHFSHAENLQDSLSLGYMMHKLYRLNKPTIALVHGSALGGGVGLVACSDIVIAGKDSLFRLPEARIGITPAVISPYVISAMGERNARRYILTGDAFDAEQAKTMGLVHEVVAVEILDATAEKFINSLLLNGPVALLESKNLIADVSQREIDESLVRETAKRIANIRVSPEGQEGLMAFLEKRKPHWVD